MPSEMARIVVGLLIGLAFVLFPIRTNAQNGGLGCFIDGDGPGIATCEIPDDCALVGGFDCTQGACVCSGGPLVPFCSCATTGPAPAPVVSGAGLIILIGLLSAVGVGALMRRKGLPSSPS